jgi:hypothetical protein
MVIFWRGSTALRRPLVQGQLTLMPKQTYIYFIAIVKPLAFGDGQLFGEIASRVLGCGFDKALGQAVWITLE